VIVASGYTLAFGRLDPPGDAGMVAPRMLGPEVRACYEEGAGFITAVGVHRDATGRARERVLAVARAIGGLRQGAIEMTAMQEAVLDLGVEQVLSPALTAVNTAFVQTMIEHGIPVEAIVTELVLSGEVERTYRLLREVGYAVQSEFHSPTSQYGQLSRRGRYDHLDFLSTMREIADDIENGTFADEWDAERDAGYPTLTALKEQHAGPAIREYEADLRRRLGPTSVGRQ
jgi:ketol-acid reductoisomerase